MFSVHVARGIVPYVFRVFTRDIFPYAEDVCCVHMTVHSFHSSAEEPALVYAYLYPYLYPQVQFSANEAILLRRVCFRASLRVPFFLNNPSVSLGF